MKRNYLYSLLVVILLLASCEKDPLAATTSIDTQEVTSIAATAAIGGGRISSDGKPTIKECGIEWCTASDFKSNIFNCSAEKATLGDFSCEMTDLTDATTYYVRSYAKNNYGTIYGPTVSFTTQEMVLPTVTTSEVTDINRTSATVGGEITNDGNADVTERGIVYSTNQKPTIDNNIVTSGKGSGAFTCNIIGLNTNTTYYVRAYAVNSKGLAYGEEKSFTTTDIGVPTVTTSSATNISYTSATVGGNVIDDGGANVIERGVVYSTTSNPTISNSKVSSGIGKDAFTCNLNDLQDGTTYYVRAYAVNSKGIAYSEEESFTTKKIAFSVSSSKQVTFSPGNLQYHPANKKWRFAESQLDCIGDANKNCSSTYNGWLDLFGWSTSTTNFGVSTSEEKEYYEGSFVDWGTNKIGNDAPNTWRTLTSSEWYYIRYSRTNADSLCGVAQVNGVNGLILLPDYWTCPSGVSFKSGFHSDRGVEYYADYQTFTANQWSKLEASGAVFLPAAGYRYGSDVELMQSRGEYGTATIWGGSQNNPVLFLFDSKGAHTELNLGRVRGRSVRLVKDL